MRFGGRVAHAVEGKPPNKRSKELRRLTASRAKRKRNPAASLGVLLFRSVEGQRKPPGLGSHYVSGTWPSHKQIVQLLACQARSRRGDLLSYGSHFFAGSKRTLHTVRMGLVNGVPPRTVGAPGILS